ncbi:CAC1B protein, partial [Polypterus senegalus]
MAVRCECGRRATCQRVFTGLVVGSPLSVCLSLSLSLSPSPQSPPGAPDSTQGAARRSAKKPVERGRSEETPGSTSAQVGQWIGRAYREGGPRRSLNLVPFTVQESVEMKKMEPGTSGHQQPVLENQGRAASMPRLNTESQPIPDSSPMKRSVSTLTPQRAQEVSLKDYSLQRAAPDRAHHHHHHHRCHRRKDRERKQHSSEKSPTRQASTDAGTPGDPSSSAVPGGQMARDRGRERGRSHERKHHSCSSEKQRYYSCDRYSSRDYARPKSNNPSRAASPSDGHEAHLNRQGSGSVSGSPVMLTSGASTPGRGRRQLPQTPTTPRPNVTYRTANSSPIHFGSSGPPVGFSPGRLSRGLSEHNALLRGGTDPQNHASVLVNRISSDPYLGQRDDYDSLTEDTLTFEDAVASNAGRHSRTSYLGQGVPNGYHYSLGVNAGPGPGGRGRHYRADADEEDWC